MLSAFLYAQFERIEEITNSRKKIYDRYTQILTPYIETQRLSVQDIPDGVELNYHGFYILFKDEVEKDSFIALMKEKNIYAYIGYLPLHSSKQGQSYGYTADSLPITEDVAKRIVRLPIWAGMTDQEMDYTVNGLKEVLERITHES